MHERIKRIGRRQSRRQVHGRHDWYVATSLTTTDPVRLPVAILAAALLVRDDDVRPAMRAPSARYEKCRSRSTLRPFKPSRT
jgi:hypothetical protein